MRHPILASLLRFFWRRRYILLESLPAFGDSPRKVYDELVRRGYHRKYKFIWLDYEGREIPQEIAEHSIVVNPEKQFLLFRLLRYFCAASILSNRQAHGLEWNGKTSSFYITHGSPIKDTHSYYFLNHAIERAITAGDGMNAFMSYGVNYPEERLAGLGYPRNDDLFCSPLNLGKLLGVEAGKFVAWYPTFRQHKGNMFKTAGSNQLPLLHNEEVAASLNNYAASKNMVLVLKPHFLQDTAVVKNLKCSNILLIDDDFFLRNKISSYQFVGSCDALITDYSSIMYDFTLCDKPIALIWEDVDEYRKTPGIAPGVEQFMECAHKVYSLEDMKSFLDIVMSGNDPLEKRRKEVKLQVNASDKADNTERVTNYIINQAKL